MRGTPYLTFHTLGAARERVVAACERVVAACERVVAARERVVAAHERGEPLTKYERLVSI